MAECNHNIGVITGIFHLKTYSNIMCVRIRKHLIKKQFLKLGINENEIDWARYGLE